MVCNCCGKQIREKEQDFLHVKKVWGYFSGKDTMMHEFAICETCYDQWEKQLKIPVKVTQVTEIM